MSKLYIFAARQPLSSVISAQKCLMLFSSFSLFNAYWPPKESPERFFFLRKLQAEPHAYYLYSFPLA